MIKLLIKVDSYKRNKLKAFYRMDALAQELKDRCEIIFLCNKDDVKGIMYLTKKNYEVHTYLKDELLDELEKFRNFNIIIDSPNKLASFDFQCQKICKKTIYIDEKADRAFKCDMVINPLYGAKELKYLASPGCGVIKGRDAVLIRDEFVQAKKIPIGEVKTILMIIDHTKIADLLINLSDSKYYFKVIIEQGYDMADELNAQIKSNKVEFFEEDDFEKLVPQCDMAITSYNSFIYDLIGIGMPVIGVALSRNDIPSGQNLMRDNLINAISIVNTVQILSVVNSFAMDLTQRNDMQKNMTELVSKNTKRNLANQIFYKLN
ncbi:hypothetical protein AN641_00265 [Candidatus Epulonipiscioides gigas]|nr:hypothetical protein AN641_00265 [Epulopiscium sp. SCG-C07WGA-EpuloA2]